MVASIVAMVSNPLKSSQWPPSLEGSIIVCSRISRFTPQAKPYIGCHTHAHGFCVGMGVILLFMGGHEIRYYC